jgi:hypothetical protein
MATRHLRSAICSFSLSVLDDDMLGTMNSGARTQSFSFSDLKARVAVIEKQSLNEIIVALNTSGDPTNGQAILTSTLAELARIDADVLI